MDTTNQCSLAPSSWQIGFLRWVASTIHGDHEILFSHDDAADSGALAHHLGIRIYRWHPVRG